MIFFELWNGHTAVLSLLRIIILTTVQQNFRSNFFEILKNSTLQILYYMFDVMLDNYFFKYQKAKSLYSKSCNKK